MHDAAHRWLLGRRRCSACVALLFLLWWQRELARDYRRLFNLPLTAATAAVLAVALAGAVALSSCAELRRRPRAATGCGPGPGCPQASAVAAQAAAVESRWFVHVDGRRRLGDRTQFTVLTRQLDTLLAPAGYATAAEVPAYTDVRSRYQVFLRDDAHLRRLKAQGDTDAAAVELTAVARGDIAFDFWDFATTLDALAGRQLAEFTAHAADASGALGGWPAVPAGALGAAGLLVLPAIRPRLAEYR